MTTVTQADASAPTFNIETRGGELPPSEDHQTLQSNKFGTVTSDAAADHQTVQSGKCGVVTSDDLTFLCGFDSGLCHFSVSIAARLAAAATEELKHNAESILADNKQLMGYAAIFGMKTQDDSSAKELIEDAAVKALIDAAPCQSCPRRHAAAVTGLSGVRLGARERQVLLAAAPCSGGKDFTDLSVYRHSHVRPVTVDQVGLLPQGSNASERAALGRAASSLMDAGLVSTRLAKVTVQKSGVAWKHLVGTHRTVVELTALGEALMAVAGDAIRDGSPIRWKIAGPLMAEHLRIKRTSSAADGEAAFHDALRKFAATHTGKFDEAGRNVKAAVIAALTEAV